MTEKVSDARLVAVYILQSLLLNQGSLTSQLSKQQTKVKPEQQALLKELCFGVARYYPQLNSFALHMLEKPFNEKDMDLYAILLSGLYQIEYMSTPAHAVVNEAVKNTSTIKKAWAGKLINAVLRRYLRDAETIKQQLKDMPSVQECHPKWLLKRFKKHWPTEYEQIITANNARAPMCLRTNLSRVSRETEIETLEKHQLFAQKGQFSHSAIYLNTPTSVENIPNFYAGDVSVQDEAAQLSAELLMPNAGDKILDACAAPGGKTGHLLESAPSIELTAIEIEQWRLAKIKENLDRLSLSANLICADASKLDTWWDGQLFDKVLLDAPCSATGVIRRNPDIKINRKPADIDNLVAIQANLLRNVWQVLKPNGLFLYATCSLMPEENNLQIEQFVHEQDDVEVVDLNVAWGKPLNYGRQLFPQLGTHDGFYYCLLRKSH
ncbi:16S rRNA (cytosine(967)-C(5))-methyltransferase RsmB [Marinomonas agarivorans]|nr:16S rRNA (cytosine(967)-C(5))-methyltransferase RsmB [Marinomonas agarivorans]